MYAMVAPPDNDVLWARSLHYSHSGSPGLIGVSVGVRRGEVLAVTGPRGSGKTTLLRCLAGQLVPEQGEVWFDGVPVHTMGPSARERLRRDRFGWIGPEPGLLPELKVWENAALPLLIAGAPHRAAKHAACEWLDRLDIGAFARKRPSALTRAESQRVALARALVGEPSVIFADDPTAPLHRAEQANLLRTLTTAARSHEITVLLATHDERTAEVADRRVALLDGRPATAPGSEAEADADATATAAAAAAAETNADARLALTTDAEGQGACSLSV
ncbi:ATP-binding cassette domain-containing protein [Streptomyces sp. G-G2]|uniref:ABC transporter ATP-binding protein n=1 Tax=Streptomyces sp. G-G2 TaxID=3046201 RepID=UPI0024BB64BA|nr:ATP-binding cassette domain-containing protein [Streptomyces sp. G-G2]MDJ0383799.1 ATP-binding cassette domain-containing protein [Streptomyces sp. G-G2]